MLRDDVNINMPGMYPPKPQDLSPYKNPNADYISGLLDGRNVKQAHFEYPCTITVSSEGNGGDGFIQISNSYDYLIKDIEIYPYSQGGNLFGLTHGSLPPDRFTMMIKQQDGYDWFGAAVDISRFNPMKTNNAITPMIINANTRLNINISHSRAVHSSVFGTISIGGGLSAPAFPVVFQVILIGARLYPNR